jgi:hypothetical protein
MLLKLKNGAGLQTLKITAAKRVEQTMPLETKDLNLGEDKKRNKLKSERTRKEDREVKRSLSYEPLLAG